MKKNKITGKARSLYLHDTYWKMLKNHAIKIDRSTNWVIANIIENWITRNKKALKIKA